MKNGFTDYQNQMVQDVYTYINQGKSQDDAIDIVSLEMESTYDYVKKC